MYELVSVLFPFADISDRGKPRPGFVISPPFGKHQQVIVAYITTKIDEILETDQLIDSSKKYFPSTGLLHTSVLKIHRLTTFQPSMIKEGQGSLPHILIPAVKKKLKKVFQLQ